MPINPSIKILQGQGLGSRKVCEKIFHHHITRVNEQSFDPSKDQLQYGDRVEIDGQTLVLSEKIYILMNKPEGYETSHKPSRHPSVFDLLPARYLERGVQAAGRLDVDTTGLLLFSDDGQFLHQMISGKKKEHLAVEKEYWITTARPLEQKQIDQLLTGVQLHDEPEPICAQNAWQTDEHQLKLVITTGKYHQVKRMLAAVGNHVVGLHRHRVGSYTLPEDLEPGQFKLIEVS